MLASAPAAPTTPANASLPDLTATQAIARLCARDVTAVQYVQALFARYDGGGYECLNAFISLNRTKVKTAVRSAALRMPSVCLCSPKLWFSERSRFARCCQSNSMPSSFSLMIDLDKTLCQTALPVHVPVQAMHFSVTSPLDCLITHHGLQMQVACMVMSCRQCKHACHLHARCWQMQLQWMPKQPEANPSSLYVDCRWQ